MLVWILRTYIVNLYIKCQPIRTHKANLLTSKASGCLFRVRAQVTSFHPHTHLRLRLNLTSTKHQQIAKMSAEDDSSDLSSLSSLSPAPSDIELDEAVVESKPKKGIQKYFSKARDQPPKEASPPPRKRSPSPPHEYVLADNPDIAVCTMLLDISILLSYKSSLRRVLQALRRAVVAYWTSWAHANNCSLL